MTHRFTTRRRWLGRSVRALGGLWILSVWDVARGARILAVRMWPAPDYTRLTVESDEPLAVKPFVTAQGAPRLVIDIEGLELDAALRELVGKVRPDDPYVAGIRVGQYAPRTVRLVVDLKQAVVPQQFSLTPVAPYQHRLVLDLYPAVAPDPLLQLVREKEASEQRAAQAVNDALGDFIGRIERPPRLPLPASGPTTAAPSPSAAPIPGAASAAQAPPALPASPAPSASAPGAQALQDRVNRLIIVALDPGHGGEDPGAIGPTGLKEKDVVLQIALQLRERLNALRGVRVMMTRDADFFVPLHERVRKARRVQADLFISIHADAFMRPQARGASVFALSTGAATSSAAKWMAQRENAADAVGGVNASARDPQVLAAMLDMSTSAQIKDSLKLGTEVLGRLGQVGRLHKPRVEQAGFAVLKAPDVPSILVETAFISNPQEEERLRDPQFQSDIVEALVQGIQRYFARHPPLARERRL